MKTIAVRTVRPVRSDDPKKKKPELQPAGFSIQQIQDRASAKTEILLAILASEERGWRHGGLNE